MNAIGSHLSIHLLISKVAKVQFAMHLRLFFLSLNKFCFFVARGIEVRRLSHKFDVVVVGAGLAGICAALTAARSGALVALVEANASVGGRIGLQQRFPIEDGSTANFAYFRETGILEEILLNELRHNLDGDYIGRELLLTEMLCAQERLQLFKGTLVTEAELSENKRRILAISGVDRSARSRRRFKAETFIDCSGNGSLSQMAGAPGEFGLEEGEYEFAGNEEKLAPRSRYAVAIDVRHMGRPSPFVIPSWIQLRWEGNDKAAIQSFLQSFEANPAGLHMLDWAGKIPGGKTLDSAEIAYSAWDYLKNRSSLSVFSENYSLAWHSESPLLTDGFRIHGNATLSPEMMEAGKSESEQVAVGRSPVDGPSGLLASSSGKITLPGAYGIPLSCLISSRIRNLLVAGEHASCTHRVSSALRHPATSAQLGEATGLVAARSCIEKRLPRTLAKPGYLNGLRLSLSRLNHSCSPEPTEDLDDISRNAKVSASTVLGCCSQVKHIRPAPFTKENRLLQFPVVTETLDEVSLLLSVRAKTRLRARLLSGAQKGSTIPGDCIEAISLELEENTAGQWVDLAFNAKIQSTGWYFLEIEGNPNVATFLCSNSPVGVLVHSKAQQDRPSPKNPYSSYHPVLPALPEPGSSFCFKLTPNQPAYSPENIVNGHKRPSRLPNLWISEPTDFTYPEFIELHWPETVSISEISIVFDSTLEYPFPAHPTPMPRRAISSIVKEYRIYAANKVGHWSEIIHVEDNFLGFRNHSFDAFETKAIELEVLSTHGLPRAQVYQIHVYP